MLEVRDAELVYDHCACGALWFDSRELEEYARRYADRAMQVESPRWNLGALTGRRCPRCPSTELRELVVDAVKVHACVTCRGHLLDHESGFASREREENGVWLFLADLGMGLGFYRSS